MARREEDLSPRRRLLSRQRWLGPSCIFFCYPRRGELLFWSFDNESGRSSEYTTARRVDAFSLNLSNSQLAAVTVDRSMLDRRAGIEAYFVIKMFGVGRSGEPMANGVFGRFRDHRLCCRGPEMRSR